MTLQLWTLFAALNYPYLITGVATAYRKKEFGHVDAKIPRVQQAKATGIDARAHGAAANSWEALAIYAPCVLFQHFAAPESTLAPKLSLVWLAFRTLHPIFYIGDKQPLRTASFAIALVAALGIFLAGGHVL
jgi:uncharacterized MAPEG superfamily protein